MNGAEVGLASYRGQHWSAYDWRGEVLRAAIGRGAFGEILSTQESGVTGTGHGGDGAQGTGYGARGTGHGARVRALSTEHRW